MRVRTQAESRSLTDLRAYRDAITSVGEWPSRSSALLRVFLLMLIPMGLRNNKGLGLAALQAGASECTWVHLGRPERGDGPTRPWPWELGAPFPPHRPPCG
jgi:hypothetical protein